mgnify:CR=1 FL=1
MPVILTAVIEGVTLVSATPETLLHVGAGVKIRVHEWGVSFDGVTASDAPVEVQLLTQSTVGTASSGTPVARDRSATLTPASDFHHTFTVEPTLGAVLESHLITPNGGLLVMQYMPGSEPVTAGGSTEFIGLKATAPTSNVSANAWIAYSEE